MSKIALAECLKHPAADGAVLEKLENVDVVTVSDAVIADIHQRFMNIGGPTDVITFDHGEILISADTARSNALLFKKSLHQEIALYIIHGLLHLNGYKDKFPADARIMHTLQERILATCLKSKDCPLPD